MTTVADDEAVFHDGVEIRQHRELEPDTDYERDGLRFHTLPRPPGERLATVATVNDVHFGEIECGILNGVDDDPIYTAAPGDDPYPEVMNRGAIADIKAIDPDAVVVKGDLTSTGTRAEYQSSSTRTARVRRAAGARAGQPRRLLRRGLRLRRPAARDAAGRHAGGDRHVRPGQGPAGSRPRRSSGLDQTAAEADRPILRVRPPPRLEPRLAERPEAYFGINPDDSEQLVGRRGPAAPHRRVLRGPHPSQPGAALLGHR
jgi:hypothetical protein